MLKSSVYLGIDIGGTTAKYAMVKEDGTLSDRGSFVTGFNRSREDFIEDLFNIIDKAITKGIEGVGISSLGIVESKTGTILGGVENLPLLHGINLVSIIRAAYPELMVSVANDAKSAAAGENWIGEGADVDSFFMITLGTGIGGVAVIDSKVCEGANYRAGEVGYLEYRGEEDYLERHYSTTFVMEKASKALGVDQMDGKTFFERIEEGCTICIEILDWWAEGIARLISSIVIIMDPDKILLGGGVSARGDVLIPKIYEKMVNKVPSSYLDQVHINEAKLGNDAGMIGAIRALIDEV